jgi:hypothetical protein
LLLTAVQSKLTALVPQGLRPPPFNPDCFVHYRRMLLRALLGLPPAALAALIGICILYGPAKGVLGRGIPLLAVLLTAPFMDLPAVMALPAVPIFVTNLGQTIEGAGTGPALLRLWPILLAVVAGAVAGVHLRSASIEPC